MSDLDAVNARARILDRGYRRYTGPRTGVRGAITTVWWHSVQRALGIRRSLWAKVLPVASVAISYVPAIVFVGLVALLPPDQISDADLPTYGQYFPFIQSAVVLFIAFVGPEVLCTDRRTGMLGIYLASPLTRDSYLVAKALAVVTVISLVTVGPTLLMLVAYILQGVGPDGPAGVAGTFLRIIVSGLLLSCLYTAVSLGISSLTDRKAFATAATLLTVVASSLFLSIIVELGELPGWLNSLSLIAGPFALVEAIHGERVGVEGVTLFSASAGLLAWTLLGGLVARVRYQMLQVTR